MTKPLVKNVANQEQVDNATRVTTERANKDRDNVRRLLATPEGRSIFSWLIRFAEADHGNPFAGEATHTTAFHCGMLNVAQRARALAEQYAPDLYLTMWKEGLNQENALNG